MRVYGAATLAALQKGDGKFRVLIWIGARNRATNETEFIGVWNGDQTEEIVIGGQTRLYHAGFAMSQDAGNIVAEQGTNVRIHRISLSPLADIVRQAVIGYDMSLGPVEIHRAVYDTATDRFTDEPHRVVKGWVDHAQWTDAEVGGESTLELAIASAARAGTRFIEGIKSDADQLSVAPGDRIYRYSSVSKSVELQV